MNLRKDHYRVPPEGRRRPPSRPSGNGCEKKNRSRRGRGRGEMEAPGRGARGRPAPPSRNARGNPQRNASAGGGSPGESRGRGETASGGPPPLRHPRGNPPAGRPSRVPHGPRRPLPGGAEGARKVWKPRAREPPRAGGARPSARTPEAQEGGGSRPPGPPTKDPPPSGARKLAESPRGASEETYLEREQRARLLAVDHSARASMKNAASCEN